MDEPQQIVQVALNPQFLQLQSATHISSDFADECKAFFASGGTPDGMYGLVLQRKALELIARQQTATI